MGRLRYIVAFRTRWPFQFPGEYFDFVYIDSDHRYATVKEDFEPYFKKLKVGGLLCGDDYVRKTAEVPKTLAAVGRIWGRVGMDQGQRFDMRNGL